MIRFLDLDKSCHGMDWRGGSVCCDDSVTVLWIESWTWTHAGVTKTNVHSHTGVGRGQI